MRSQIDFLERLRGILSEADQEFARTGDPMVALEWIALAAKNGAPVPPAMGAWLHTALTDYKNGASTMDAAMGLAVKGKAQPRRRHRADVEMNETLGRMWWLIKAGATRPQAAALAATRTGRQPEQLDRSYGKSWFVRRTDDPFAGMAPEAMRAFVVEMLGDYPDSEETRQEKAAILSQHPHVDTLASWRPASLSDPEDPPAS